MGFLLDFAARIRDGNRETAIPHHRQVDDIVPHEGSLAGTKSFLLQYFLENRQLILDALVNMLQLQITGAKCHCLRNALGDQPSLDPSEAS